MPFIFLFIVIAEFLTTPIPVLFFDQPEYLNIISNNSFLQSLSLGHFPVHPVFMAILYFFTKFISANLVALFFGTISTFVVYKISQVIFKEKIFWLAAIIFSLFPGVWLLSTNLMVESISLTFYLAGVYAFLKKRNIFFAICIFLMVATHLEAVFWIPTIFLIPFIFGLKFNKKIIVRFIKYSFLAVLVAAFLYASIYFLSGRNLSGSNEQLMAYFSSGIFRMIRNFWLSFIRNFGSLTPFLLSYLLIKNIKTKREFWGWFIFILIVGVIGFNWQGDYMPRRIIFAALILALSLFKFLKAKSVLLILYLAPIIIANGILYFRFNPEMPIPVMQKRIDNLPKKQVLIQTHYLKPFTYYDGTILWIGGGNLSLVDGYLNDGRRVIITKESVTAPYRLPVGNNFHITSLGKVGNSESKFLFEKYAASSFGEDFELFLWDKNKISSKAGEAKINYSSIFREKLARQRIDYGDAGSWVWAILTKHKDPTGWIYKDARGLIPGNQN